MRQQWDAASVVTRRGNNHQWPIYFRWPFLSLLFFTLFTTMMKWFWKICLCLCLCVGRGRGNIDWGGGADVIIPVLSACLITCLNVRHISHQPSRTPTQVSRQKKWHACQNSWYMTLQSGKYSNWFSKGYFFDSSALQNGYERNKTQITQLQRCFEPIMWAFIVFVFWIICHIRPAS